MMSFFASRPMRPGRACVVGWARRIVAAALAIVLMCGVLAAAGCDASSANGAAGSGRGEAASRDGEEGEQALPAVIRFGLVPSEGGTDIVETFRPLMDHLERTLGVKVEARSASEYVGVITAMKNGQVDFAYFGPKSYIEAARIADAEALVKELDAEGNQGYFAILVVRSGSMFATLDDVRGRTLAMVSPNSTSGYLAPRVFLSQKLGSPIETYFGQIQFAGSHGSVLQRVAAGDVEVGATNTLDLTAMSRSGQVRAEDFREIWRSPMLPSSLIAVRRAVPEHVKQAVAEAITSFNDAEQLRKMGRSGFVPASDEEYDPVRLLEQRQADQ